MSTIKDLLKDRPKAWSMRNATGMLTRMTGALAVADVSGQSKRPLGPAAMRIVSDEPIRAEPLDWSDDQQVETATSPVEPRPQLRLVVDYNAK